jgi:hypothetical protein
MRHGINLDAVYNWFLENRIAGRPYAHTSAKKDAVLHATLEKELGSDFSTIDLFRFLQPSRSRCPVCDVLLSCKRPEKEFNFSTGFRETYCGRKCAMSAPEVRAKIEATHLKNRGVRHVSMDQKVVDKRAKTFLSRHGGYTFASEKLTKKARETMDRKYGVRHYSQTSEWRAKSMETSIKRIGVPFWTQDAESSDKAKKSSFQYKEVVINGEAHSVQGYEPQALKYLEGDAEEVITVKAKLPHLMYVYSGVTRRYYPDALVYTKSRGTILLEVKSTYTIRVKIDQLVEKFNAARAWCSENSVRFCVIVVESNGNIHEFFPQDACDFRSISERFTK